MPKCEVIIDYIHKIRCEKKETLTPILFYDPITFSVEVLTPCNQHSNNILRPYFKPYLDIQKKIREVRGQIEKSKIYARTYEITPANLDQTLEILHVERNNISKQFCIEPLCQKPLDKTVYPVVPIGQDGKVRHFMYFHKNCAETLKHKLGQFLILNQTQTTLN